MKKPKRPRKPRTLKTALGSFTVDANDPWPVQFAWTDYTRDKPEKMMHQFSADLTDRLARWLSAASAYLKDKERRKR